MLAYNAVQSFKLHLPMRLLSRNLKDKETNLPLLLPTLQLPQASEAVLNKVLLL
jgi:hypothetical protein